MPVWKPSQRMATLGLWPLRAIWILVPFTVGPLVDDAAAGQVASFRVGVTVIVWGLWALTLIALLVPRVETLTFTRMTVPLSAVAALWSAFATDIDAAAVLAVAVALLATVGVLSAPTGDAFVNGSSYGDERRMLLRPPVALLAGPVVLSWIVAVMGTLAGPLLLLTHRWALGALATVVGLPLAGVALRAMHQLGRRWIVFVPAGFVLHDHLALSEPVLFPRRDVVALGPAPAATSAHDLTVRASGLALQVDFAVPVQVAPIDPTTDTTELVGITQFIFMPSRPGQVLAEAERRAIRVRRG